MRDELFQYYVELGNDLEYEKLYYISVRRTSNIVSGFLLLASAAGISALSIWSKIPVIWSIIAVLAQIVQALQPLMQSSKQRAALKYMIQDKEQLCDEICNYWEAVGAYEIPEEEFENVRGQINDWKRRERESRMRFSSDIDFPIKRHLIVKAKERNRLYFWYHYSVDIEEELKIETTAI